MVWEPFHLGYNPSISALGFNWINDVDWRDGMSSEDPRYAYCVELFSGKHLSTNTLSKREFSITDLTNFKGLLIKCVNASMMVGWLSATLKCPAVHMVRHPCAVVSSQMKHGWFGHVELEGYVRPDKFLRENPWSADILESLRTTEELLAFTWCVQNYGNVFHPAPGVKRVRYEDLVLNTNKVVDVLNFLGCAVPEDLDSIVAADSRTTIASSIQRAPEDRITAWRRTMDADAIQRVSAVVSKFGYELDDLNGVVLAGEQ